MVLAHLLEFQRHQRPGDRVKRALLLDSGEDGVECEFVNRWLLLSLRLRLPIKAGLAELHLDLGVGSTREGGQMRLIELRLGIQLREVAVDFVLIWAKSSLVRLQLGW